MTKRHLLLAASALVAASTIANAQDVVMRRPLSSSSSGQSAPTPTPTPTGSTPTPTPTPTGGGPVISDPNGDRANGYGWSVDCTSLPPECHQLDTDYDDTIVDDSMCPATQSPAADSLAHDFGYLGMAEAGTQHGAQFCSGADPAGNKSVYVAYENCNGADSSNGITGEVGITCDREIFTSPITAGQSPLVYIIEPISACESQPKNQDWLNATTNAKSAVDPTKLASKASDVGQSCTGTVVANANGLSCGDNTCTAVIFDDDPYYVGLTFASYQTSLSDCQSTQTVSSVGQQVLAQMGLIPGGPNAQASCSSPDVYAAKGKCVDSVTYDTGWPTPPAMAHVNSGFQAECFAVYNSSNPDTLTLSQVSVSNCQNQHPTQAQEAILQSLAPDLQDYSTLDTNCSAGSADGANYQRDQYSAESGNPITGGQLNQDDFITQKRSILAVDNGTSYIQYQDDYYVPYVCTDATASSFYSPSNQGLYSQYPMTTPACDSAHAADAQAMKQFAQGPDAINAFGSFPFGSYSPDFFTGGQCASGGCGVTFSDQQDKQRYKISVVYAVNYEYGEPSCTGPDCAGL